MENQIEKVDNEVIVELAIDNQLALLKTCLEGRSTSEITKLISGYQYPSTNEVHTPLEEACYHGHYDIVEYLVQECKADIEQPVLFKTTNGETYITTPLWIAAHCGHINIVKLLVQNGVNLNSTGGTNSSTPLSTACSRSHFEIVKYLVTQGADFEKADGDGYTCLMRACWDGKFEIAQYLLSLDIEVNRRSIGCGSTALHFCARSGSLDILQMVLKHGANMQADAYEMTPLLLACWFGHMQIVEYLLTLPSVSREERIAALEFLGAVYANNKGDIPSALFLWRRAIEDRTWEAMFPKDSHTPNRAYCYILEKQYIEALNNLSANGIRMLAFVICARYEIIMGQNMWGALSPETHKVHVLFMKRISNFMKTDENNKGTLFPPIYAHYMLTIFNILVDGIALGNKTQLEAEQEDDDRTRAFVLIIHMGCLLVRQIDQCSSSIHEDFIKAIYKLNSLKIRTTDGRTALHYACSRKDALLNEYPLCAFPSTALTKALLMVGADPNLKDKDGNTPLHLSAESGYCSAVLLAHGAHFDATNNAGETFQVIQNKQKPKDIIKPADHLTLACVAAKAIRKLRVTYVDQVPKDLCDFIEIH